MISHKYQCIFVHIPRTGGTSIEEVIWPHRRSEQDLWMGFVSRYENKYQTGGLQHLLAAQILQEVGPRVFNTYFKFAFVRNPWDKAVSQYAYMRKRPDLCSFLGMTEKTSFAEYLDLIRARKHIQWTPQVDFICQRNTVLVDFIGRFESINEDARTVFHHLGINNVSLRHTNSSNHRPYAAYYSASAVDKVEHLYQEDVDVFGYEFERSHDSSK